jgi:hypothetical protein
MADKINTDLFCGFHNNFRLYSKYWSELTPPTVSRQKCRVLALK